ncbi:MetQ/NlpA family ABC transporter substrate-binding protein [Corynebacterium uterequi]|uniref:ABC-type metal ion transport system, periplasmic component/surface antigen n=1 Tax=Corynebacterium uterequi TaxID=1072256 RepID=A0A0G3HCM2_9CORY|nr:MetQ/NlpA family ABC transporter substrate-binding protein [Corynebacterium uterequi]AKK10460.1 ABC-type metal ion transport system, periplasmic component/surface antigen [Corynebacterium uterequi]
MKLHRVLAGTLAVTLTATGLVACGSNDDSDTIKIGTTDANLREWDVFTDLAEQNGIDLEVVAFSDYNTPNQALAQGEIDINKFQHILFLSDYNAGSGDNLKAIGATEIYPLALFWKDHDSLAGIEGKKIAIPNDPTNQGRAINVLVQAGLVTLKEDGLINPSPADIDQAKSKVEVTPVDAAQTTIAYGEGTPAVINNSFLERAGIDAGLAIFQDDPDTEQAEPYINVFATTEDRATDPTLIKLTELWKDPAVAEAVLESSGGTAVAVDRTPEELAKIQARLEDAEK